MSDRQTLKQNNASDAEENASPGQKPKSYYYDDSTGYETYNSEAETDDGDDSESDRRAEN
jgi:hypothetical protein